MKPFRLFAILAFLIVQGTANANVLIGNGIANGNFVHGDSLINVPSISGWTSSTNQFYINGGSSTLNSAPFGADIAAGSRSIQLHNNAGTVLHSDPFSLDMDDKLALSFDLRMFYSTGAINELMIGIYTTGGALAHNFGTIAGQDQRVWVQQDFSGTFGGASGSDYELRFTVNAGGADFHLDRVHLNTVVPEPAPVALLCIGMAGLFYRLRKSVL